MDTDICSLLLMASDLCPRGSLCGQIHTCKCTRRDTHMYTRHVCGHTVTQTHMNTHIHHHPHMDTRTHICMDTQQLKNEKRRQRLKLQIHVPLGSLPLFFGNFHVSGKIENENKSLFLEPEGRFYLYPKCQCIL
jgi:hypothetical protein